MKHQWKWSQPWLGDNDIEMIRLTSQINSAENADIQLKLTDCHKQPLGEALLWRMHLDSESAEAGSEQSLCL